MMTVENELEIREKAVALVKLIQDEMCIIPRSIGKKRMTCKFDSTSFLQKINSTLGGNLTEIEWIQILKFLRENQKFRPFYENALKIPFEHDGGSIMHFPEVYKGNGKILVRLKTRIDDLTVFYPDVPGIDGRSWDVGDLVYVPEDRARRYLEFKWMEIA